MLTDHSILPAAQRQRRRCSRSRNTSPPRAAAAGCSSRLQQQAAAAGCSSRLQQQAAAAGCSSRLQQQHSGRSISDASTSSESRRATPGALPPRRPSPPAVAASTSRTRCPQRLCGSIERAASCPPSSRPSPCKATARSRGAAAGATGANLAVRGAVCLSVAPAALLLLLHSARATRPRLPPSRAARRRCRRA
jgi:hypothetical protein